jgi:chromosome segregation ATPase
MRNSIRAYERVASKYKWDYQAVEFELAESLEKLGLLSRTCNRLSAELDNILSSDTRSDEPYPVDTQRAQSVLQLAAALNEKLVGYRHAYHQQAAEVVKLRKKLLQARTRRDKSHDRHQSAIVDLHKRLEARELEGIADLFAGRLHLHTGISAGKTSTQKESS